MLISDLPTRFNIPFGNSAAGPDIRPIPEASQIGITAGAASLTDGFPPACFVPPGAGGTPPWGADFNGLLKQITLWNRWQAAGAPAVYDATFSTAISGYPKGTVLNGTTTGLLWYSLVDNNTVDPNAGASANWLAIGPYGQQQQPGNYVVATGTNAYAITLAPPPPNYASLVGVPIRVKFPNGQTTQGMTLNVNTLGAKTILRSAVTTSQPQTFFNDVLAGNILELFYDGVSFQIPALNSAGTLGSGSARTTTVPNTGVATDIFAAVQATASVYCDQGGGNAFSDVVTFYQGGSVGVTSSSIGTPSTRAYTTASSVLRLALTGGPGGATVTPVVLQSSQPTP